MENKKKIVNFDEYCPTCANASKKEEDSPCDDCLGNPVNGSSHKPVYYKQK
jgi:hypothetical protein